MILKQTSVEQMDKRFKAWNELSKLTLGSKVKLTTGEEVEFLKLKRKNFSGKINGKNYDIPIELFDKVIEVKETNKNYNTLKQGDLFVINVKNSAEVYKFINIEKGKIMGINPITGQKARIDPSLYYGTLNDIHVG